MHTRCLCALTALLTAHVASPCFAQNFSKIYISDPTVGNLQRTNADGSGLENLTFRYRQWFNPKFIDIDPTAQKLYVTSPNAGGLGTEVSAIYRCDLDGGNLEQFLTFELEGVAGGRDFELDIAAGKAYYTCPTQDSISSVNLDGSNVDPLYAVVDPEGLALDLPNGMMYWMTDDSFIQRASIDGKGTSETLLGPADGLAALKDIELDLAGKMYWSDFSTNTINRADTVIGATIETLVSGLSNPYGIDIDLASNKIYWLDGGDRKIERADLDGMNRELLVDHSMVKDPRFASILNSSRGVTLDTSSELIFWTNPSVAAKKVFRANMEIPIGEAADSRTDIEAIMSTGDMMFPVRLALDIPNDTMYWTEAGALAAGLNPMAFPPPAVWKSDLNAENMVQIVPMSVGLNWPSGIDIDRSSGVIYWADAGVFNSSTGSVYRVNNDGSMLEELASGLQFPTGICVDITEGRIYWVEFGWTDPDTIGKVQSADLDGGNVTELITTDTEGIDAPNSITLDLAAGRIYFSDAGSSMKKRPAQIYRADLDGTNLELLVDFGFDKNELDRVHAIALDIEDGMMYWANSLAGKIQRANMEIPLGQTPTDRTDIFDLLTQAPLSIQAPQGLGLNLADADRDGVQDDADNCDFVVNILQGDVDGDSNGDLCDVCPGDPLDLCDEELSAAAEIPAGEGGIVETPDGSITIDIEPGDLNESTTISITESPPLDPTVDLILGTGPSIGTALLAFILEPEGLNFDSPVTLTVVHDVSGLPPAQQTALAISVFSDIEMAFVEIPTACMLDAGIATCEAELDHFSTFALVVPSSCNTIADCADLDEDNTRDDACIWWECDNGLCQGTDIVFADMGGQFGECPPDGTADGNDRFHALNCFANTDPSKPPPAGYPCEPHPDYPPTAYNVDACGQFGDCNPDGVCDGNDAFCALNAFAGTTTCSCPLDGNPMPEYTGGDVQVVGHSAVMLVATRSVAEPGDLIHVDVFLEDGLPDFRGYQLHLDSSGGGQGTLELVDIAIDDRADFAFHGHSPWNAFNVKTGQVLVGLDANGVTTQSGSYLATFTFKVAKDASGPFVIELLYDDSNHSHRTFLFPTPSRTKIEITSAEPARIDVVSRRLR